MNAAPPALPPRMFRLTYANVEKDEAPRLHRCRDGMAFDELAAALAEGGGRAFATTVYLYPHDARPLGEFPAFRPTDLIVLPTRPPLDDPEGRDDPKRIGPRKIIKRNDSALEGTLFAEVRKFIKFGTRKRIQLTGRGRSLLLPAHREDMGYLVFYENRSKRHKYFGAQIQCHLVGPGHEPRKPVDGHISTVAYLIRSERVAGPDCGLLVSFGMDGFSTLIWNRILRARHPEWLRHEGFLMAELIFRRPVPERALTPEFADDADMIEVRLLTKLSLKDAG